MLRTIAITITHLLAIIGAGFLLASGHAYVRTAWMDQPAVSVTRMTPLRAPATTQAPPASPTGVTAPDATGTGSGTPQNDGSADVSPPVSDPARPVSLLDAPVKPGSITLREAADLFEQGAFFLDARYEDDFNAGRIEGAFWMPASRVPTEAGRVDLEIIEPGGIVIIYCTGGDCDASENTANRIEQFGYSFDIRILGKGYSDWVEAGLPVEGAGVNPGVSP